MDINQLNNISIVSFLFLLAALILSFLRLIKGPSLNDRIAALDLIASVVMGFVLVYSVVVNNAIYIDIVIVISLISFIGTIAISSYLKNRISSKPHKN